MNKNIIIYTVLCIITSCSIKVEQVRSNEILPQAKLNLGDIDYQRPRSSKDIFVSPKMYLNESVYFIPENVEQFLSELELVLGSENHMLITHEYIDGLEYFQKRDNEYISLLKWDVSHYLYRIWHLDRGFLGGTLTCLGASKLNLESVYMLAARQFAENNNKKIKKEYIENYKKLDELLIKCNQQLKDIHKLRIKKGVGDK